MAQCPHCFAPDGKPHATNCPANGTAQSLQVATCEITKTHYPQSKNGNAFQDGMEFQDWIVQEFGKIGFYIQLHASKRYQFERGEAVQRVEIKLDRGCTKSGRLSIEVGERTAVDRQWVESGIYRADNSIFYVQGNYELAYLFDKRVLQRYHATQCQGKYEESPRDTPTVRKFYMPFAEADKFCIVRIPLLQAMEAKVNGTSLFF